MTRLPSINLAAVLGELEDAANPSVGAVNGPFCTGFDPLDSALRGGLRSQDLVLVGGKPGVGKTMAALQWARTMVLDGADVVYACYEHPPRLLASRLLLLELASVASGSGYSDTTEIQRHLADFAAGWASLEDTPDGRGILADAIACMRTYADRLWLVPAASDTTDVVELRGLVKRHGTGRTALFVDYLQKVAASRESGSEEERMARVACDLKDLAMTGDALVVAIAASTSDGLTASRQRVHHLRNSAALAYEADVIIMVNEKVDAVSKVHLAYDPVRAQSFRDLLVLSIEKNRNGPAGIDLEFQKDFAYARIVSPGGYVAERLLDGRVNAE